VRFDHNQRMSWYWQTMFGAMLVVAGCLSLAAVVVADDGQQGDAPPFLGPCELAVSKDGKSLYVAFEDARQVAVLDLASRKVIRSIAMPEKPTGLAVHPNGTRLYATCAAVDSTVVVLDTTSWKQLKSFRAGHTAHGPAVAPNGKRLYVCNRFNDDVSVIDLTTGKQIGRVPCIRQPVAAAVTPDNRQVVVANLLPLTPSNDVIVAASVTLIDASTLRTTSIRLPDGAINLRDVVITPDGKHALITHVLANFILVASQVDQGWLNTAAISVIDLEKKKFDCNVLLDDIYEGAANPWGVALSPDGKTLCATHSGTHDMSLIDLPAMYKQARLFGEYHGPMSGPSLLEKCRRRIDLPGNGPRDMVIVGSKAFVAEYFSDTIAVVDLDSPPSASKPDYLKMGGVGPDDAEPKGPKPATIRLGPKPRLTQVRRGEMLFHDATICFEHWQSCASCHPGGRGDALNWDLLNDGGGNPKNTKNLLFAHRTPPSMALGVRKTAEDAVRAGIEHILFKAPEDVDSDAIYAYIKSLRPTPSPHLVDGRLSESAQRGKRLFNSDDVGCAECHPAPLYTDLTRHKVSPSTAYEYEKIDTPSLIEIWRSAPYLHNGRYTKLKDLIVDGKHGSSRGDVEELTEQQVDDLVQFLLSL